MAYSKVVASLLVALISSLISCVQINATVIHLHNQYIRDRQDILRLLSMNSGHTCQHKILTVSSSSTSPSVHLYVSAYFFLTFSVDLDIFSSDKLQASTVYTSQ